MTQQLQMTVFGRECTLDLSGKLIGYWILFLRLLVGWWFLREGLNKYVTPGQFRAGWFLEKTDTVVSPVLNAFAGGASEAVINVVIPMGELLIGLGLILGVLTRTAAFFGASLMFFFYFGAENWRRGLINGDLIRIWKRRISCRPIPGCDTCSANHWTDRYAVDGSRLIL